MKGIKFASIKVQMKDCTTGKKGELTNFQVRHNAMYFPRV